MLTLDWWDGARWSMPRFFPDPKRMSPLFVTLQPAVLLGVARHFHFPFHWTAQPVMALVAGIFILIRPKLLNFIVAVYLILVGLMGLFGLPW